MIKFLILGNQNAITYKEIFPYIKENKLWLGMNWVKEFIQPNGEIKKFGNICWFTNVENKKRNQPLDLYRKYNPTDYPKYDNYDAIEVSKVKDIPIDYDGVMGVPITFLDKYCNSQFEIINGIGRYACIEDETTNKNGTYGTNINGKPKFFRILIKRL